MAHINPEKLQDLEKIFALVRTRVAVKEKKPGIFYWKSKPLLHFHEKEGRRYAHLRCGEKWVEVDVKFGAGPKEKTKLWSEVQSALSLLNKK
jgi:hypothetical protein